MARSRAGWIWVSRPMDAVGDAGDLTGQVVIESDDDLQVREGVIVHVDSAQGVGHRAGGFSDDVRVTGVGFRVARVQVGDAAHRQAGQVGHIHLTSPCYRDGQGADRGGLVEHDQHVAVPGQVLVQCP